MENRELARYIWFNKYRFYKYRFYKYKLIISSLMISTVFPIRSHQILLDLPQKIFL